MLLLGPGSPGELLRAEALLRGEPPGDTAAVRASATLTLVPSLPRMARRASVTGTRSQRNVGISPWYR